MSHDWNDNVDVEKKMNKIPDCNNSTEDFVSQTRLVFVPDKSQVVAVSRICLAQYDGKFMLLKDDLHFL